MSLLIDKLLLEHYADNGFDYVLGLCPPNTTPGQVQNRLKRLKLRLKPETLSRIKKEIGQRRKDKNKNSMNFNSMKSREKIVRTWIYTPDPITKLALHTKWVNQNGRKTRGA